MARRSSQEWQSIIEQQEASGLSVADFCKQQQLDFKYFHARKWTLLKRLQREQIRPFIKVGTLPISNTVMELQVGGARLSLPLNCEPLWLAQLLKAVAA